MHAMIFMKKHAKLTLVETMPRLSLAFASGVKHVLLGCGLPHLTFPGLLLNRGAIGDDPRSGGLERRGLVCFGCWRRGIY